MFGLNLFVFSSTFMIFASLFGHFSYFLFLFLFFFSGEIVLREQKQCYSKTRPYNYKTRPYHPRGYHHRKKHPENEREEGLTAKGRIYLSNHEIRIMPRLSLIFIGSVFMIMAINNIWLLYHRYTCQLILSSFLLDLIPIHNLCYLLNLDFSSHNMWVFIL